MANKKNIKQRIKEHKKEIIISGIAFATCVGLLIVIKNRDSLSGIYKSSELHNVNTGEVIDGLASSVEYRFKEPVPVVEMALDKDVAKRTFEVSGHIRNLSMGHRASQTKIDIAKAQGIELLEGQTLVATYTKGLSAA